MAPDDTVRQPAISILSAAHGAEPHLAEMIDSVRAQTVADWELIVVDDGMSEEVARIVAGYADDPRIRLLRREHRGLAAAVDAAAAEARGRYYAVLAGDGRLAPAFCERVAAVLAEHPEIDVLCGDAVPFLDGQDQPPTFRRRCGIVDEPGVGHRYRLAEVVPRAGLYTTAAIRASAWEAGGGFRGDAPQVDSLAMCLRMLAAGCDLRVLPEVLGGYRVDATDPEHVPADQDEYEASLERAFGQLTALSDDPEVLTAVRTALRGIRYDRALRLARRAMRGADPATARRQAGIAFRQRPGARPAAMWVVLRVAPGGIDRARAAKRQAVGFARSLAGR